MIPRSLQIILVASVIGFLISVHLALYTFGISPWLGCIPAEGFDCDAVDKSEYSRILGVPNSVLGIIGYVVIFAVCTMILFTYVSDSEKEQPANPGRRRSLSWLLFGLATGSLLYSAYLTYAEVFLIHALCSWCLLSALMVVIIFFASISHIRAVARQ